MTKKNINNHLEKFITFNLINGLKQPYMQNINIFKIPHEAILSYIPQFENGIQVGLFPLVTLNLNLLNNEEFNKEKDILLIDGTSNNIIEISKYIPIHEIEVKSDEIVRHEHAESLEQSWERLIWRKNNNFQLNYFNTKILSIEEVNQLILKKDVHDKLLNNLPIKKNNLTTKL